MSIAYNDGTKLGLDERLRDSDYISNYYAVTQKSNDSVEWKTSGYGAAFRGETSGSRGEEKVEAYINSVACVSENEAVYSFSVNNMSGLYKKNFALEKASESHVIHSNTTEFLGADYNEKTDSAIVSIKTDAVCANLALIDLQSGDYRAVTGGDSKDSNPSYSVFKPNTVLYDTSGVGRDYGGSFVKYAPAKIAALELDGMKITEIFGDDKYSYVCPKDDGKGNIYCIRRPVSDKKKRNIFIDILLIPWRILQAIYYFLESFVLLFTGKTFTEKTENPTKGRSRDSRSIMIDGNLIEADKEFKRNQRNKDKLAGFIPLSWQLVRLDGGSAEVIKKGVSDFDVLPDGTIVCANGKHVLKIKDGKTEKIADGSAILKVAALKSHPDTLSGDIFG